MNTEEMVAALAEHWDMTQTEARDMLDKMIQTFNDHLARGYSFTIPELGTFKIQTRKKRHSYNPHYEKYIMLPPKQVVDFSPSEDLKEDIKNLEVDDE